MKLKYKYKDSSEIPEGFKDLYSEVNGEWILTGVEGVSTSDDVERLKDSLRKEREDHKGTKDKLSKFKDLDPDKLLEELDELAELRATKGDSKSDEEKIENLVEARIQRKLGPLERERDKYKSELEIKAKELDEVKHTMTRSKIQQALNKAALDNKVVNHAVEDILLYSSNFDLNEKGEVVHKESGLQPELWLTDMKEKRPHWWPSSVGGGASGSNGSGGGSNPWSEKSWNLTEQGKIVQTQGIDKAKQLAAQAGVDVYATAPKKSS